MTTQTPRIEEHPDIAALRARYDRVAETPTAQAVDGLTLLTGLYLAMSSWIVGFVGPLAISNRFTGLAVALLALVFAANFGRTHGIAWVIPVLGVWAIISPWLVDGPTARDAAVVSNIIAGALTVLFGLGMTSAGMRRT
ncbi:SPW repeat protein [Phytohabitans rumicis]|uniref:SPW repeat protein n=1 Tax=Phytohabitans rumicis TaxID=1076125 RepID=UPI0031F15E59